MTQLAASNTITPSTIADNMTQALLWGQNENAFEPERLWKKAEILLLSTWSFGTSKLWKIYLSGRSLLSFTDCYQNLGNSWNSQGINFGMGACQIDQTILAEFWTAFNFCCNSSRNHLEWIYPEWDGMGSLLICDPALPTTITNHHAKQPTSGENEHSTPQHSKHDVAMPCHQPQPANEHTQYSTTSDEQLIHLSFLA